MTVCLTGDVHHMSLETRDQEYMDRTEVEAAIEYAEVAAEYDVPVTLFVTGKAAEEEPERVKRLAVMEKRRDRRAQLLGVRHANSQGVAGSHWLVERSASVSALGDPKDHRDVRRARDRDHVVARSRVSTRQAHGGVAVGGGYHAFFRRGGTGRRGSRGGRIDCGSDKHAARSRARVSRVSDAGIRGRE